MNADDEKKLFAIYANTALDGQQAIKEAYALGRARGMTEAAGIASDMAHGYSHGLTRDEYEALTDCAAAIEKARDAK